MGVDECQQPFADAQRTESSATLVQFAESDIATNIVRCSVSIFPLTIRFKEQLLTKIEKICEHGGDGVTKTAIRMEMAEMAQEGF